VRVASCLLFLAACAGAKSGNSPSGEGTATFKVFYPDQPADGFKAKVGKRFAIKPVATCTYENGRDARWSMTGARLEEGTLPDGITIEEGVIAGVAKAPGTWSIKVKFSGVTCAGKQEEGIIVPVILTAK
jgi:hypothetical protein